jgi:N,N'-diacetyllegionaminate synthase
MKQRFEIRGRAVGLGEPTFLIAEAGSNHNNSLDIALRLVDAAADAGADAVKFQTFQADRLYAKNAGRSEYLGDERSINDIIRSLEMPAEWLPLLRDAAHARGLAFLSTPFHEEAVELLEPIVDAFKVASYELSHHPLLQRVAATGKPLILSTGAHTVDEIAADREVLAEAGNEALVLLQCTAAYPAPPESVNVRALVTLRERFGLPTGLSDHSRDPVTAPAAAAALGAAVIEKHFTLSNRLPGPDHPFAVEPHELTRLVRRVRDTEVVLGTGAKEVVGAERELRHFALRSVFTTRPVQAGERFSRDNVDVLRRGTHAAGLSPDALGDVLRAVAARDLDEGMPLQRADLELRP